MIPPGPVHVRRPYATQNPLGYGRRHRALAHFAVRAPRRVVVPLSPEQVRQFWQSLRTFRDLSLTALLLFDGLRSQEALQLQLEDLRLAEAQLRVRGKGNRDRVLPLPPGDVPPASDLPPRGTAADERAHALRGGEPLLSKLAGNH